MQRETIENLKEEIDAVVSSTFQKTYSSCREKWEKCFGAGGDKSTRRKDIDGLDSCS